MLEQATGRGPVVVELFTSQGCSSCPSADHVLGELARDPDVLALSMAVDYWDYLGWPDTFARPAFTARQRAYAAHWKTTRIYTPQVPHHALCSHLTVDRQAVFLGAGS